MCGRIALTPKLEKIIEQFGVTAVNLDDLVPSYNVAPSKLVSIITYAEKVQKRQIELMKWGLVPGWAKDPKIGSKTINFRAESVATKFKAQFRKKQLQTDAVAA
jgi:putative SOS response-associated peptidase YedK